MYKVQLIVDPESARICSTIATVECKTEAQRIMRITAAHFSALLHKVSDLEVQDGYGEAFYNEKGKVVIYLALKKLNK